MGFGMQLRYWFHKSSPSERAITWGAMATVLAVLIASVALTPENKDEDGTDLAVGTNGQTLDSGGIVVEDPSVTVAGGEVPVGVGGAPAGGGAASGRRAGAAPGAAAARSGGASGTAGSTVELTASDRGVSRSEIKVGFTLQNPAGLNSAGFSTGQRNDGRQYVDAMAAWASRRLHGRKVVPVFRYTDPTSVEDQAAACRAMVNDAKVFGVVDVAAILDTASLDCLVNRSKGDTPFVHSVMWSRDWQARSGGNEISYQAAIDRISVTWARDLGAMRWFPSGATVGILGDKCPATEPTIVNVLGPALKQQGATKVVFGNHDCDIESVASQPPNIATRFRLEGVTHVLLVSNFVASQIFISSAASQGYQPKYSTSDWFLNTADPTSANFDPNQFDGSIGIASLGTMLKGSGKAPYPGWEVCSQIATGAGLPPIAPDDPASNELLGLCDNFILFVDALAAAGPNPTRGRWREAVGRLGERTSALAGRSRFAPDKLTGSDFVHTVRWQRDCRCWRSITDFRPAAA